MEEELEIEPISDAYANTELKFVTDEKEFRNQKLLGELNASIAGMEWRPHMPFGIPYIPLEWYGM